MKRILSFCFLTLILFYITACTGRQNTPDGVSAITVEIFDRGTGGGRSNPTNNNWTKWIQEKMLKDENVQVTFVAVPRSEEVPGLNNLIASGTPPDICLTYSNELITNYQSQNGLFDMAPYTGTLLKDMKAFLGPDPTFPGRDLIARKQDRSTGAIYAIPGRRIILARHNTYIRKDWLDKLGLPLPTTAEEFYNTLAAFKEKDPGGVGKDKVIPFISNKFVQQHVGLLTRSFEDPNISAKERWINTIGEFEFLLPGQKEGFRFLNRMYNAGLIDRDFPLYPDNEAIYDVVKSGIVGAIITDWGIGAAMNVDLRKTVPTAELVAVDPFRNSAGKYAKPMYDPEGIYFFIPKTSKNPEGAMKYANWLAKYENYMFLQFGEEGVVHTKAGDLPQIKAIDQIPPLWVQNSNTNMDYIFPINGTELGDPEKNLRYVALGTPDLDPKYVISAYETAMRDAVPVPVVIPSSPLTASGPYMQTLTDKAYEFFASVITARSADFDRVWDAGVAGWLASGGQVVIDERRAKYVEP